MQVALKGAELYVEERGSGSPLLLIAGIPAIANDWAMLAEPLEKPAESRRLIEAFLDHETVAA